MNLKIKFLTVVWGEKYIKNFCELSLPSFMAPGNLPALAQASKLEVLIMSQSKDFHAFEKYPAFRNMNSQIKIRFVPIDDLIPGNIYGVTLTLAYARPILALGKKMLDYHFVFMNADFILADGSLRTLGRQLSSGVEVVLAPSLRVTAERTETLIRKKVRNDQSVLQIQPREFLRLTMPHLHPTTLAKVINFGDYHTIHPNQLFWKVDGHTLLAKYFLIFMLAIKPQRVVRKINSWCDYGFVPEFCPQSALKVLGDSDEFLMIETQEKQKEKELLRHGPLNPGGIKESLGQWLTLGHFKNFQHRIVYHAKDLPQTISKAQENFEKYIQKISFTNMRFKNHKNHYYWKSGLACWLKQRQNQKIFEIPQELEQGRKLLVWLQVVRRKISYECARNLAYSWTQEESIMEPRLVLLEKKLKEFLDLSDSKTIVVDQNTLISTICLLRRIVINKKAKITLLQLSQNQNRDKMMLSSIKASEAPLFITSDFPSAEICKSAINNKQNGIFFLLPTRKSQLKLVEKVLVDLRFHDIKHEIIIESFVDPTFWFLKKVARYLKLVSVDVKEVARNLLKRNLYGNTPNSSKRKMRKWNVRIPHELLGEIQSASWEKIGKNRDGFWRKRYLQLGQTLVYCTFPSIDETVRLPKIRIPLLYRAHSIANRMLHENNFVEELCRSKPLIAGKIPSHASLCVIRLSPRRSFS
jgi:hypothetical protein